MKTKILFLLLLLFTIPLFAAEQEGNKIPNSEKERNFQTAALFQGKKYDPFLKEIDRQIQDLIDRRITPGAVVVLGRKDRIVFCKAYGNRQEYPKPEKMTLDTLFDLASVSKVAATGLCVNILIDRKQLDLDQSVGHYLPEFTGNGKEKITVRDLLLHVSGIRDEYKTTGTEEEIWKSICNTEVKNRPGKKYEYSCLSYVILGKLIERISGEPLCVFAKKNIYDLLCMKDTGFQPNEKLRARTAPTEKREGKWLKGNVNDWRNAAMGGGAGNAGLFSTGIDLAILAQVLLNHGIYTDSKGIQKRLFCEETFQKMVAPYKVPAGYRGLSWDKATGKPNLPPEFFPTAIGHGGHTGTSFLVDPERDLFVIVLTTRLHLNPKNPNIYPTAGEIARITAKMFQAADQPKNRID